MRVKRFHAQTNGIQFAEYRATKHKVNISSNRHNNYETLADQRSFAHTVSF